MHGGRVVRCRTLVVATSADRFAARVKGLRTLGSAGRTVLAAELEWIEIGAIVAVIYNLGAQMKRDARSVRSDRRLESIQAAVKNCSSVVSRFAVLTVAHGVHFASFDGKPQVMELPMGKSPSWFSHRLQNADKQSLQTIRNRFESFIVQLETIVAYLGYFVGLEAGINRPGNKTQVPGTGIQLLNSKQLRHSLRVHSSPRLAILKALEADEMLLECGEVSS
jgi:hypothetical protein